MICVTVGVAEDYKAKMYDPYPEELRIQVNSIYVYSLMYFETINQYIVFLNELFFKKIIILIYENKHISFPY